MRRSAWGIIDIILSVLCLVAVSGMVEAAELRGTIYDQTLRVTEQVLVEVNSTPQQRLFSTDGSYAFMLLPGTYAIVATFRDGGGSSTSTEIVTITEDGDYIFDLFLIPDVEVDEATDLDEQILDLYGTQARSWMGVPVILLVMVVLLVAVGALLWRSRKKGGKDTRDLAEDDAETVLRILHRHGGRITQKELRKELPMSEAKVSMIVAELEAKGKIQKIKKGRGNILVKK